MAQSINFTLLCFLFGVEGSDLKAEVSLNADAVESGVASTHTGGGTFIRRCCFCADEGVSVIIVGGIFSVRLASKLGFPLSLCLVLEPDDNGRPGVHGTLVSTS